MRRAKDVGYRMLPKYPLWMHLKENRNYDRAIFQEPYYTLVEMVVHGDQTADAV